MREQPSLIARRLKNRQALLLVRLRLLLVPGLNFAIFSGQLPRWSFEVANEAPHRMGSFAESRSVDILDFLAGIRRKRFRAGALLSGEDHYSRARQHPG